MRPAHRLSALLLILGISACDRGSGPGAETPAEVPESERYGGTAVIGLASDAPKLNPLARTGSLVESDLIHDLLFLPTVGLNEDLEPAPALAESWEVTELGPDSLQITFRLRDDVYWHDGVKTTAWDVQYTFDQSRETGLGLQGYSPKAEVVDSFTVRVRLKKRVDPLLEWNAFFAVPRHLFREIPRDQLATHPISTERPVGNGPFRAVAREPSQSWTFVANKAFPQGMGGRPYLDTLVVHGVEPERRLSLLLDGTLDLVPIASRQAAEVKAVDSLRVLPYPERGFTTLIWNMRREPVSDVRVRRAFTLAVDREDILSRFYHGYGQVANGPVPPFHWAHNAGAGSDLAYDPAQARALLKEAGWEDRDGDGIRENERGEPLRIELIGTLERAILLELVQENLKEVGVDVRAEALELNPLIGRLAPSQRAFDGALIGLTQSVRLDDRWEFHCLGRDELTHLSGYCDPEMDRLIDRLHEVTDRQEARPYWMEYQEKIARVQPYTYIAYTEWLLGAADRLQNVKPDLRGALVGADRWWIRPDKR